VIRSFVALFGALFGALPDAVPQEQIRAKVRDILARPEFAQGESAIGKFLARLLQKLEKALSEFLGIGMDAAGKVLLVLVYALLFIAIVLVAWRVIRSVREARRATPSVGESVDPASVRRARVADLRARAQAAQAAGDNLLALRLFFTALVVGLGEVGDLEYRDAWTNRELLERGRPKPVVEKALAPIVTDLDRKSFGGEIATAADASGMARLVDELLGAHLRGDHLLARSSSRAVGAHVSIARGRDGNR
jgi:hypothetical protein